MVFSYNGKKSSGTYKVASGCLLFVVIGCLILFFSLIEDIEQLKEYSIEVTIILIMLGFFLFNLFRKKGKTHQHHIKIENNFLFIGQNKIPLNEIHLDIYNTLDDKFSRYHIWDNLGQCSFYSIAEDDFSNYLATEKAIQNTFKVSSTKRSDEHITIVSEHRQLYYNLESGFYKITEGETLIKQPIPKSFCIDGRFLLNHPANKQAQN